MNKQDANLLMENKSGAIVAFGGLIAPEGANITHTVKIGGGSFTDGKILQTGLPEFMINDEEDEMNPTYTQAHGLYALRALTGHEYGHVWFTNFKTYKVFNEKLGKKFEDDGVDRNFALKIVSNIFNATEDGRIEARMTNMYPGLLSYFRYLNGTIWQMEKEEVPKQELQAFLRCIVVYAVVGIMPKWYKLTKGNKIRDEFEKIKDIIDQCVDAHTCKQNTIKTEELILACYDYLLELMKKVQKDQEAMQDMMDELGDGDFGEGTEGEGDGAEGSIGSASPRMKGDGDSGEGTGSANSTGDNSGGAGDTRGQTQEVGHYNDTEEMSKDSTPRDYSGVSGKGGGSKSIIKSKEGHKTETPEEMIKEATSEAEKTVEKEVKSQKTAEAKKKTPKGAGPVDSESVKRMVSEVGYDREHVRKYREERNNYSMIKLPEHLHPAASKFRRKVEKCFKEKNTVINKMSSGRLDCRQLHKIGMKEYNVFQKKANRSDTDAVVEICWDGSGSMCGGKQKLSGEACAIVEYGLKGVVPLKIINFSVDWGHQEVIHYLVKDFDESDKNISYSASYTKSKGFNGGNKDGYDIRICTEDLMKRPEKDKILIVMSDGLPSDYNSIDPMEDVKDAVKIARKKGIIVIPIFFGDEYFRESEISNYEYMYEKYIINSAPEELPNRLVKLFETLILR